MTEEIMQANAADAAAFLKSLAHPERLMVICQLAQGEMSAGELQERSQLSQSAFSQQLKVLRDNELVAIRKVSQQVFYSLADPKVKALIELLYSQFCGADQADN